jgi:hypothetical protein
MNHRLILAVLAGAAIIAPRSSFADDKAACLSASSKGQTLRDQHKLIEARQQFRLCAAGGCPSVVQTDCASWLSDIDRAVPTIVLSAKNGSRADLFDVKVSVDGQPLAAKLDGQALAINPGPHTFHFEEADGTHADVQVLIKEGERSQPVEAVLGAVPATPPPAPAAATGGSSNPMKTAGWIIGGVGVAGLALGTVFGIVALNDKNNAGCVDNLCNPGTSSGIKSAALASDVGWIAGGVLLAGGAALVLLAPGPKHEGAARVQVAPTVMAGGGGAVLGGTF